MFESSLLLKKKTFRIYIGTSTTGSEFNLPVDITVNYGGSITMPSTSPTLSVEQGSTLVWCGSIGGMSDVLLSDGGSIYIDYPASSIGQPKG